MLNKKVVDRVTIESSKSNLELARERSSRDNVRTVISGGITLLLILIVTLYIIPTYLFSPCIVKGKSMLPTLAENQCIVSEHITLQFRKLTRGDIISVYSGVNRDSSLAIKRVIAIGGDTIECKEGVLKVNGEVLKEKYAKGVTGTIKRKTLENDEIFVMGDNREKSNDSRDWGCLPVKNVTGLCRIRVYPLNMLGGLNNE